MLIDTCKRHSLSTFAVCISIHVFVHLYHMILNVYIICICIHTCIYIHTQRHTCISRLNRVNGGNILQCISFSSVYRHCLFLLRYLCLCLCLYLIHLVHIYTHTHIYVWCGCTALMLACQNKHDSAACMHACMYACMYTYTYVDVNISISKSSNVRNK